uniref:Uncharacterized protein n=1 Tax=Avena sativa TaxID=4498 RepID=A0ACD5X4I0_AVESA
MDAQAAVLQLSVFTTVKSIPRPERYADFPVTVRLVAPGKEQTVRAPIDIVVAIDTSRSVNDNQKLEKEKAALALLVDMLLPGDRLAVVPFDDECVAKVEEELVVMSAEGKEKALSTVKNEIGDGTRLSQPLERAELILAHRKEEERAHAGLIILLSDGEDTNIMKDKEWTRTSDSILAQPPYPVHTFGFGFSKYKADTMGYIAKRTNGTYTDVEGAGGKDKFAATVAGLVTKASSQPFSAVGVGAELAAVHPGVSLVRIDSGGRKASISSDARSGTIDIDAMKAGETAEFTVYLDVPEGDADVEAITMEVMSVSGAYTQDWDGERVKLGPSVVSVERPVPPPPETDCTCKELDLIEERLKYWCKVKSDLAAMYEKAEAVAVGGGDCKCNCEVTAALRESSFESVNRAMHHDIYTAVVHALRLRLCDTATATEHGCDGDKAVTTTDAA